MSLDRDNTAGGTYLPSEQADLAAGKAALELALDCFATGTSGRIYKIDPVSRMAPWT